MTAADKYRTPEAFKVALEVRVRRYAAVDGVDMNRFRQLLVFDRFLARIGQAFGDRALLKGCVVLELRLDRARATRDIDLRMVGDPGQMLAGFGSRTGGLGGARPSALYSPKRQSSHRPGKRARPALTEARPPASSHLGCSRWPFLDRPLQLEKTMIRARRSSHLRSRKCRIEFWPTTTGFRVTFPVEEQS